MDYKLFLDDERFPVDGTFVICRNVEDAVVEVHDTYGYCPSEISFDHDLGENEWTGYDFAKWLVYKDMEMNGEFIPEEFRFSVHSQNPVGKRNIEGYLENYLEVRKGI